MIDWVWIKVEIPLLKSRLWLILNLILLIDHI